MSFKSQNSLTVTKMSWQNSAKI